MSLHPPAWMRRWLERRKARAWGMNTDEGHLGGYIAASPSPSRSGLDVRHGDPGTWTPALWQWAVEHLGVGSVLDVGCGEGHAAAYFRDAGCDVIGVDGSKQAFTNSVIPDAHVVHDFTQGPYTPPRPFDLVWSCEFVEHVEERFAPNFLQTFQAAERFLMLTYAEPGQPGWHHVNCQPSEYWIEAVQKIGFEFDTELAETSRRVAEPGHYRERGLLFTRR